MKKVTSIFLFLIGFFGIIELQAQAENYPSLGYFPDYKVAVEYQVQAGDYMGKIAKRFKLSAEQLRRANLKLAMTDNVKIGDILKIYPPKVAGLVAPDGTPAYTPPQDESGNNRTTSDTNNGNEEKKKSNFLEYRVQQGDTLYGLGRKFKVHPEKIRRANLKLAMTDHVEPGDVIKIPIE